MSSLKFDFVVNKYPKRSKNSELRFLLSQERECYLQNQEHEACSIEDGFIEFARFKSRGNTKLDLQKLKSKSYFFS